MTMQNTAAAATADDDLTFDVREIPFSYRGSWLNVSPVVGLHRRAETLHLVSHRTGMHPVLSLVPTREGVPVETEWVCEPAVLAWRAADGDECRAVFDGPDVLRMTGAGAGMRLDVAVSALTPFSGAYLFVDPVDGSAVLSSYETGRRYRVTALAGSLETVGSGLLGEGDRSIVLGADGRPWEVTIEEITAASEPLPSAGRRSFDEVVTESRESFTAYLDAVAPWRRPDTPAAARAAYVLWSATVFPEGFVTRETVFMSKHWMDKIWSWDHCFNALALAPGLPDAGIAQLLAPFDHQDASGALPDSITHSEVLYNFVKPPIHGWALRRLRATAGRPLDRAELVEIHQRLAAWSTFWLSSRRAPGRVLPYYQHGNDSGWDNSTTFDLDRLIESPDLAAFLSLQLEVLADLSDELGLPAHDWSAMSDQLRTALVDELWSGTGFVAKGVSTGRPSTDTSLLNLLPVLLGERLPDEIRTVLVERIRVHLTGHGLATEQLDSPHYEDDGYWRGPIWAPSTALIEDGLRATGAVELADDVNGRFRALCEQSGFAENFDAISGAGLRDRAYTWTAAVYLLFAADHVRRTTP
jgi:glycogen debranching enzyme